MIEVVHRDLLFHVSEIRRVRSVFGDDPVERRIHVRIAIGSKQHLTELGHEIRRRAVEAEVQERRHAAVDDEARGPVRGIGLALPLKPAPIRSVLTDPVRHESRSEADRHDVLEPVTVADGHRDRRQRRIAAHERAVDVAFVRSVHAGHRAAGHDAVDEILFECTGVRQVVQQKRPPRGEGVFSHVERGELHTPLDLPQAMIQGMQRALDRDQFVDVVCRPVIRQSGVIEHFRRL